MIRKNIFILSLALFFAGILLRKLGIHIGMVILIVGCSTTGLLLIYNGLHSIKISRPSSDSGTFFLVSAGICFLLLQFRMQYWIPHLYYSVPGILLLILITFLFSRNLIVRKEAFKLKDDIIFHFSLLLILWMLVLPAVLLNPREYHNFFRSTTYEEFIRNKFAVKDSALANGIIDRYKDLTTANKENSKLLFQKGLEEEKNKNFNLALVYFNRSIDSYPDNAESYFQRGSLKLNSLDINADVALSAIKDFSRSIELKPNNSKAWHERGMAYHYLRSKNHACYDFKEAMHLDSTLDLHDFIQNYCSDSGSLSAE